MKKLLILSMTMLFAVSAAVGAVSLEDTFENRTVGEDLIGSTTSDGKWIWTSGSTESPVIAEHQGKPFVDLNSTDQISLSWESADGQDFRFDPEDTIDIEFDYYYLTPWGDKSGFRIVYLVPDRWTNMLGSQTDPTGYLLRLEVKDDTTLAYKIREKGNGVWETVPGSEGTFTTSGLLAPEEGTSGSPVRVRLRIEGNHQLLWLDGEKQFELEIDPLPQNESFDDGYVQIWSDKSRHRGFGDFSITETKSDQPEPGIVEWILEDDFENRFSGEELIGSFTSDYNWIWTSGSDVSPLVLEHDGNKYVDFAEINQFSLSWESALDGTDLSLDSNERIAIEFDYVYLTGWGDNNYFNTHYLLPNRWTNMGGKTDATGYSLRLQVINDTTLEYAIRQKEGSGYSSVAGTEGSYTQAAGLYSPGDDKPGQPVRIRLEYQGNHQSLWIDGRHQFTVDIDPLPQNETFADSFVQFWSDAKRRRGISKVSIGYVVEQPSPGFAAWQETYFTEEEIGNPEIGGEEAAPAGDGISNLMKYALLLDPWTPSREELPAAVSENGDIELIYRRNPDATDIHYVVEVSSDLVTWHSGSQFVETVENWTEGNVDKVRARALTFPGESERGFMRLRVSRK